MVAWLAFQLTLTSLPGDALPPLPGFRIDWVAHFGMYAGLGFLVSRAARGERRGARWRLMIWLALAGVGVLDELHEELIPGRGAEWMDLLMDVAGAGTGLALQPLLMRTRWAATLLR